MVDLIYWRNCSRTRHRTARHSSYPFVLGGMRRGGTIVASWFRRLRTLHDIDNSSADTGTTTPSARAHWRSGRRGYGAASTRGPASRSSKSRTRTSLPAAPPTTRPRKRHSGRLGRRVREMLTFDDPAISPARHRPPGGLPPGRLQSLSPRAGTGNCERCPRVRLGLYGRGDPHQAVPDRVRLLAGVAEPLRPQQLPSQQSQGRFASNQDRESLER